MPNKIYKKIMEILSHMDNNKLRVKHKNLIKKGIVKLSVLKENTKTARERKRDMESHPIQQIPVRTSPL